MSSLLPISTYNLALKPFQPAPAIDDEYPVTIRITMAAVDLEATDDKEEPSTLRLLKRSNPFIDEDEEDFMEEDSEEDDLDEEEEAEEVEEPKKEKKEKKSKKSKKEESSDEEEEVSSEEEEEEEEEDVQEFVICTLSPKVQFQQTIDLTINPDEDVYFVVTGSYPIHLSGNYVEHPADEDSEDEYDEDYSDDEYNLTPDEDEVIDEQEYDLDDLEDASDIENKIEELVEEDEVNQKKRQADEESAPSKKSKKEDKNAKKEDKKSVQFSKELEQGPTGSTLVDKKESKKEKIKAKKDEAKAKKEEAKAKKDEANAKKEKTKETKKFPTQTLLGGVVTEDRKIGTGPNAKSGNKVGIRYIGKLKNGKVFDKNTSGKPFVFGLGKGECIKGFDLGVAGMAVGGERRVIIPAKMGYGSQALPGIPANSELTFDIKLVSLK